jgi:sterol desaturase/sphingolipid hydroxylase (fatty acid hydroxylase superfamily)
MSAENLLRAGIFVSVLAVMLMWEMVSPRRRADPMLWRRRFNNITLLVVNVLVLRLAIPVTAVVAADLATRNSWGLFNQLQLPTLLELVISIVFLDLLIYCQHVVFHKVPVLWKVHRVHHTDLDIDVTTGIRFHPFEILLSMCIKFAGIILVGAPLIAVIIFEILLNATAMFNHSNVYIPDPLDRILRCFIVTPDMHRVHHSVIRKETDSNYGFNLPWWDRLFGTYRAQPEAGHLEMTIGLNEFRDVRAVDILWLLIQPFISTQMHPVKD